MKKKEIQSCSIFSNVTLPNMNKVVESYLLYKMRKFRFYTMDECNYIGFGYLNDGITNRFTYI